MEQKQAQDALKKLRETAKKKKFSQSLDLIVTLKNFDLKKQKLDVYVDLHHDTGKKVKVCALIGPELQDSAKKACDFVITKDNFTKFKDKKVIKKLAQDYDYFIAQGDVMKDVATVFGRTLGPRAKMPNPKAGCVIPPNANVDNVVKKLQKLVRIQTAKDPFIMCRIGKEDQDDAVLIDNIISIMKALESNLPLQQNNIKGSFIKFTMSPSIEL